MYHGNAGSVHPSGLLVVLRREADGARQAKLPAEQADNAQLLVEGAHVVGKEVEEDPCLHPALHHHRVPVLVHLDGEVGIKRGDLPLVQSASPWRSIAARTSAHL